MNTVGLTFSPTPAQIRTARMLAVAVGRRSGLPEELIDEVRLAVDEACSRAVSVHNRLQTQEHVKLSFVEDNRGYQISVTDVGPAANATQADLREPFPVSPEDSDTIVPSVELAIVSGLVDDVQVRPTADGGTVVVLRWNR
jgi:anti-sigma regulatory factor (Ser/Thr protein kinase)